MFRTAQGLPFIVEFYAYDFVAGGNAAVPRSVKGDEDVVSIFSGELGTFTKCYSQRSGVRLHLNFRLEHILAVIVSSFGEIRIGHAVAIAIRPARIAAIFPEIVDCLRREIVSQP